MKKGFLDVPSYERLQGFLGMPSFDRLVGGLLVLLACISFLCLFTGVDNNVRLLHFNEKESIIASQNLELALIRGIKKDTVSSIDARIGELQPKLDLILRMSIAVAVVKYSEENRLSPSLVVHLICRETIPRFNVLSKSGKGAIGLMQIMYEVQKKENAEMAKLGVEEMYHVDNNVRFGCQILRWYIDSEGSLDKGLMKYVGGSPTSYTNDIYKLMAEYEVEKKGEANGL